MEAHDEPTEAQYGLGLEIELAFWWRWAAFEGAFSAFEGEVIFAFLGAISFLSADGSPESGLLRSPLVARHGRRDTLELEGVSRLRHYPLDILSGYLDTGGEGWRGWTEKNKSNERTETMKRTYKAIKTEGGWEVWDGIFLDQVEDGFPTRAEAEDWARVLNTPWNPRDESVGSVLTGREQ